MFKFSLISTLGLFLASNAAAQGMPGGPINPTPPNTAVNITLSPVISWTAGGGAVSHDVYFGTNPTTPPFVTNIASPTTSYSTGTLAANTTYYWRIAAKSAGPFS